MTKVKADVLQAIDAWKSGKPVRSIELGHVHRMIEHPGMSPRIDTSQRNERDQERAHEYCFSIIERFVAGGGLRPEDTHERYLGVCQELRAQFVGMGGDLAGLTSEEIAGAESLAWKALLVGWKRATDGHPEASYIEVTSVKREKAKK